jgi:uncharacterized SAM-binding protein YcdF (DUF218 family)
VIIEQEPATKPAGRRRRRRRRIVAAVGLVVLAAFGVATGRLFIWPDLPPLPGQADAIVELGGPGDRDQVALTLAREHRARFLVQSTTAADARSGHCLPPVPDVTILCFHAEPNTTRGEARSIRRLAEQYHWSSVVLVTTLDHAWRARVRVERCFDGDVYVRTSRLPPAYWPLQIPYQWTATVKAFTIQRTC